MIDTDVRYLCYSLSDSSLAGASLVEAHGHTTSTVLPVAYATAPTTTYVYGSQLHREFDKHLHRSD
ncbi:uncharacterized protein LOC120420904 isoform X2 [Culex pipiens pallens]|uniref:uncharacterized protein LOC120420904 isoform X2 n=1 Tax=Culex pipiens pallens TaxID=42434 RepID=UPI001954DFD3|nr:uncharacterized protein LOC120420904 isoform X2 [Culex pipiens pallens]